MNATDRLVELFEEYGRKVDANLDEGEAMHAQAQELLDRVAEARWRIFRNRRLLAESRRLQAEVRWLLAENATLIASRSRILRSL